jgi:sugar phosphate permease
MKRYDADLSVCQWVCGVCREVDMAFMCICVCVCVLVAFCLGPNLCGFICDICSLHRRYPMLSLRSVVIAVMVVIMVHLMKVKRSLGKKSCWDPG